MASYDRAIPPGGVGKITLEVKTTGFKGKITKSARVISNDPKQPNAKIYLSINVRQYIIVEPAPRIFLAGIEGDDVRGVFHLRAADDKPLEIIKVETNPGLAIDYELNRKEDGRQYELEVKAKSTDKQTSSGFLKIFTNHPVKKELKLPVLVRINPELEARPARILFRKRSQRETKADKLRRVLTLVNNRGKPFQVRGLSYNREYFEVRPMRSVDKPSSNHQFEVFAFIERLPASRVVLEDTLTIAINGAQTKELQVPISIRIETPQ